MVNVLAPSIMHSDGHGYEVIEAWQTAHNPRETRVFRPSPMGKGLSFREESAAVVAAAAVHKARESRRNRYSALQFLREHSALHRVRGCGLGRVDKTEGVGVYKREGRAYFGNVQRCGSVHVCPVCSPKIRAERADEIARGLAAHREAGGGVEFVTLTIQHDRLNRLAWLLQLVSNGYRAVIGSGRWAREWALERGALGVVGTIRALEINYGQNGWHPHLHVLVLTEGPLSPEERGLLEDGMWRRWSTYLEERGHGGTTREHGITALTVAADGDVARYLSKVYDTLHHEMTRVDLKLGAGRNPFRVLGDLVKSGKFDRTTGELQHDWLVWREYELATRGRQALTWSMGLKDRLGVREVTDEELASTAAEGSLVASLTGLAWLLVKNRPDRLCAVLEAAERGGEQAVYELLDCFDLARTG